MYFSTDLNSKPLVHRRHSIPSRSVCVCMDFTIFIITMSISMGWIVWAGKHRKEFQICFRAVTQNNASANTNHMAEIEYLKYL